jgi:hypothetical protein
MRKDGLLLCLLLVLSVGISTVLYHFRVRKAKDEYAGLQIVFGSLRAYLKPGSAIALMGNGSRGQVLQQGLNPLHGNCLYVRSSLSEVTEDSLLLVYSNGATRLFNPDSAGFRVIWHHRDSLRHYFFAVRPAAVPR